MLVCSFNKSNVGFFLLQISNKKYPKLKEVDDVLGGSSAWENVDSTDGRCTSNLSTTTKTNKLVTK
jgi:hypothetical protein